MTWNVDIKNIGGIRSGTTLIEPGINTIRASNWQGKSSLINAIETAMGTRTPLTEGADHGKVELSTDVGTIVVELSRQNGNIIKTGDSYLSSERDRTCAELFAFLDEDNEVRQAVRNGDPLEPILTRPIDFERIDEQIRDLKQERAQIESEFERAQTVAQNLPSAQQRVSQLEAELEELRTKREDHSSKATGSAAKRDEVSAARAEQNRLQDQKDRLETTISNTQERLEDRRAELDQLTIPDDHELEAEIAETRDALNDIELDIELVESVYTANKRVLDTDRVDLLSEVEHGLDRDTINCWICGQSTDRESLESHLAGLANQLSDLQETAEEYRAKVEEIEAKQRTIRQTTRQKQDLETEIDELKETLADRKRSLETTQTRLAELNERIDELEATVEATNQQLTDIESEIKYKEAELADAREDLESKQQQADQREHLANELESITDEIEELRTRKQQIKEETRATFDEAIQTLINQLAPGFESARLTSNFDLVVAREGREASLDALSEGEVELLGIVTALAGYEAFDVADRVPIILLDGVGEFAGENLGQLVRYLADRSTYLVTTAYPEQDISDGHVIDPTEWTVVSRDLTREMSS